VKVLKTSTQELFARAEKRGYRKDVGATACWFYPAQGQRIVLVHGFRGDHHGLSGIGAALEDFEVVIPDLPGYGKTVEFDSEHNLDTYGLWLKELLVELGNPVVVGHSFGSLVVANALAQGAEPAKVVLLNPISAKASEQVGGQLAAGYYALGRAGRFGSYLLRSALMVRGMSMLLATTRSLRLRRFIHSQHLSYFSSYRSDRVVLEGFRAANSGSVLDYSASLPPQTLIIAGSKDLVAPLSSQLRLVEATGIPFRTVEVGHLTHYEAPLEAAELIKEFVQND
jgi:pimeloyl-ACP methyl ester carboxylesterase